MWAWRRIALGLHRAGIAIQTGTNPVERMWAMLQTMLPDGATVITPRWFRLLANLAYLRLVYRHYNGPSYQVGQRTMP
jgi:hypothetical protein